jgi:Fe-S-cluster containining protein
MTFTCRQCGTCCMYLGDYIIIVQQTRPFEFECESVSTGTPFTARVDEDKREIFSDFSFPEKHPSACRFLRPDGDLIRCTIHRDSPPQCKFYRCIVMKISDSHGTLLGNVTGTLALHSDDPVLRSAWDEAEKKISPTDHDAESQFRDFLMERGFCIE